MAVHVQLDPPRSVPRGILVAPGLRDLPSVESTIVPSKSERRPSKVWICGGAEKVPWDGDMARYLRRK